MAIYTSFLISSFHTFDGARKKAKRTGKEVLALLGDANVDLDWKDLYAQALLKCLVAEVVSEPLDREAFMDGHADSRAGLRVVPPAGRIGGRARQLVGNPTRSGGGSL